MIELRLQQAAEILDASLHGDSSIVFRGVCTDSRVSCTGQLFVALSGENFDAHDFVDQAVQQGAVAALVEKIVATDIPQLVVANARFAMAKLANYWRHQSQARTIGLTGSNGKTTVKEMLAKILSASAETLSTAGNYNNDIGVPLTLYRLSDQHQFAVIEMGANHAGEIANLASIADPDIVYINNAASAHLEGFGSLEGVRKAKGEIYEYCQPRHRALFNIDDEASDYWQGICKAEYQASCALDQAADFKADWQALESGLELTVKYQGQTASAKLEVLGEHNARNAVAAIGLAVLAGIDFSRAVRDLSGFGGVKGRLYSQVGPAGSHVIDDSYNANPDSLEAGIRVVCDLPGIAWLALGDMGELGEGAEQMHVQAALLARDLGVEKMFGVGQMSCMAASEFGEQGYCFDSIDEMAIQIRQQIGADINLLVKGSNAAGMGRLVTALTETSTSEVSHAG